MSENVAPPNVADIEEALRDVIDPELGINVVDLGLLYGITLEEFGDCRHDVDICRLPAHRHDRGASRGCDRRLG